MLLEADDKLLFVHRRLFERDSSRFFLGSVEAFESGIVRVSGYSFARDPISGAVTRKNDKRTKLLSLSSGALMAYVLPRDLDIDATRMVCEETRVFLTCGKGFQMDLSEWANSAFTRVG